MACRHCGRTGIGDAFLVRLERLRALYGKPVTVTSGYRCPEHDAAIGGRGAHVTGHAADIAVTGADAFEIVRLAAALGFTGIGVMQKGGAGRFIHLDDLENGEHPRPRIWSY